MNKMTFADRYARANLKPTQEMIAAREAPTTRIAKALTGEQLFSLAEFCFGCKPGDIGWLVDEYHKDDQSFSAYDNQQECVLLASTILSCKIADGDGKTVLAVLTTSFQGRRMPSGIEWLVDEAETKLAHDAVSGRNVQAVNTAFKFASMPDLATEIAAVQVNDWAGLLSKMSSVRAEAQSGVEALASNLARAINAVHENTRYTKEESQILWWLFGENSRTLNRPFATMSTAQLGIVAGIELGELTKVSVLGPVAAPAVLDRVLDAGRKEKGSPKANSLSTAVDAFEAKDLAMFKVHGNRPVAAFPVMTAIAKAQENGSGSWQTAFGKITGLDPQLELSPNLLARQLYHEHLLGQLK